MSTIPSLLIPTRFTALPPTFEASVHLRGVVVVAEVAFGGVDGDGFEVDVEGAAHFVVWMDGIYWRWGVFGGWVSVGLMMMGWWVSVV